MLSKKPVLDHWRPLECWWCPQVAGRERAQPGYTVTPNRPHTSSHRQTQTYRLRDIHHHYHTTLPLPPTPTKENTDRETGCNQGLSARTPRDRLRPSQTCLFYSEMREMTRLSTVHSLVHFNNLTSSSIVTAK